MVKEDKVGFINRRGDVVIGFQYPYLKIMAGVWALCFMKDIAVCTMRRVNAVL